MQLIKTKHHPFGGPFQIYLRTKTIKQNTGNIQTTGKNKKTTGNIQTPKKQQKKKKPKKKQEISKHPKKQQKKKQKKKQQEKKGKYPNTKKKTQKKTWKNKKKRKKKKNNRKKTTNKKQKKKTTEKKQTQKNTIKNNNNNRIPTESLSPSKSPGNIKASKPLLVQVLEGLGARISGRGLEAPKTCWGLVFFPRLIFLGVDFFLKTSLGTFFFFSVWTFFFRLMFLLKKIVWNLQQVLFETTQGLPFYLLSFGSELLGFWGICMPS